MTRIFILAASNHSGVLAVLSGAAISAQDKPPQEAKLSQHRR